MKTNTWIALALAFAGTAALAHGGVKDPQVMARMQGMTALQAEVKVIGEMAKGARAFDPDAIEAALEGLSEEAARVPDLFEPEATDPKSEAVPEIWDEFDQFAALAEDLALEAEGLIGEVEEPGDLPVVMRTIGKTCKACHAVYRE